MKRAYSVEEAHAYLGIRRRAFTKHIRPLLPIPLRIGTTKVWERVDLDRAFEQYRDRNGRPEDKGDKQWVDQKPRASTEGKKAGASTRSTAVIGFKEAVSRIREQRKAG